MDVVSRKYILLLSFTGSAISYLIVGFSSQLSLLFFSRVIVGIIIDCIVFGNEKRRIGETNDDYEYFYNI